MPCKNQSEGDASRDLNQSDRCHGVVRQRLQSAHDQHERGGMQDGANIVQAPRKSLRHRERVHGDRKRDGPDGQIDSKQPAPMRDGKDRRGNRRTNGSRHGNRECVYADRPAEHVLGISEAHQRSVDAHDPGGAESLDDSRNTQREQRGREGAGQRGQREHHHAGLRDFPVADDFTQRC